MYQDRLKLSDGLFFIYIAHYQTAKARVGTISRRQRRNRTHEQAGRLKINFQTACFDGLPTVFAAAAAFVRLRLTA